VQQATGNAGVASRSFQTRTGYAGGVATAVHVTLWCGAGTQAPSVVLIHGSMTWGTACFESQRSLADSYRLLVVDRRGYGSSPDIDRSNYDIDAADVVELLGEGAHVVGHSYGGVVAMLAAGRRSRAVRSLSLIEPAAFRVAADHPAVAAALQRMRQALASTPPDPCAADYLRFSAEVMRVPLPELTPDHLRAARTALREHPSWDAEIPIEPLVSAGWPKLVITGTWETASPTYRAWVGEAMMACGRIVAERIGGMLLRVPGAAHEPHREQATLVNAALRDVWDRCRTGTDASPHSVPKGERHTPA
jgi:pimeloyl-ACP methyl ester carboxylesterase